MGRNSGGLRVFYRQTSPKEEQFRRILNNKRVSGGEYDRRTGGYYLIESSRQKHKPEEIEAAKILAKNGYHVVLKDEAGISTTVDGYISLLTYEQRTPSGDTPTNIRNSLFHGRDKKASYAVVYLGDKSGHTDETIISGIKLFEKATSYRFRKIIVVRKNGSVKEYRHTK